MRLIASCIALPAFLSGLWLCANDVARVVEPKPETSSATLAEAIRNEGPEGTYAFIRAGVDPNTPIAFSHPDLTGDREVYVAPMALAVATHDDSAVMTLMSFGARMELPRNRMAVCLARRLGYDDIATLIIRDGRLDNDLACPPASNPQYPLLDFVEGR